jgi:hypothetical protein
MAKETNWTAVGALAAVGSVLVALVALGNQHDPAPSPVPPQQVVSPATTSPNAAGPTFGQRAGPPGGCSAGKAALDRFQRTAGPTWSSKSTESEITVGTIEQSMAFAENVAVHDDLTALAEDFINLHEDAGAQNGSDYDGELAQIQTDRQALDADCAS